MSQQQKGFSAVEVIIIVVVIAIVGVIAYVVYQGQTKNTAGTTTMGATTSQQTSGQISNGTPVDHASYSLTLPQGWSETTTAPNDYVGALAVAVETGGAYNYYSDTNGNYVAVMVKPVGRGFEANETWTMTKTQTGFAFSSKTTCTPGEDFCTPASANEYRVGIKTDGALKNSTYFFFAGNTKQKTGVSTDVYKTIVESLVIK